MPDFIPSKDADFLAWSLTFHAGILVSGASLGLTTAQITEYGDRNNTFQALMGQVSSGETRTPAKVIAKTAARASLESYARDLARILNASQACTNEKRRELGLTVRSDVRRKSTPPTAVPIVEILSMNGHRLTVRVHGTLGKLAKPAGCTSLSVFSYVGEVAPSDPSAYTFEYSTTKTLIVVDFPPELTPGTKVFITCFWKNALDESGDACEPVGTQINYASSMPTAATMRKAA